MKKVIIMAMAIISLFTNAFAGLPKTTLPDTAKTKKVKPAAVQYTCMMHPGVLMDKPGKCPKCGMTLVKKVPAKKTEKMKM
jgi:hypothetical protein